MTRRAVVDVTVVAVAALAAWGPFSPDTVESWYSTRIYPAIQPPLTTVSNVMPIAWLDLLGVAAIAAIVVALARVVRQSWRTRRLSHVLRLVRGLVVAAAATYLTFLLLWGMNYRRTPMGARLLVTPGAPASDAVTRLGLQAAQQLNELHDRAHATGWPEPVQDSRLRAAFDEVQGMLTDSTRAVPGRLKRTLLGQYFRWTSVDGMINPFGLEVLANPDLLSFEKPFVAAHEWAHLAGYADESEASFVGWLTCLRAGAPEQYSGWLALYWQVNSEVSQEDRARMAAALAPGPRRDIDAMVQRVRSGEWPWLRDIGWRTYDSYLKANRVEEGVRSYGVVVTLILQTQFRDGWVPVRR